MMPRLQPTRPGRFHQRGATLITGLIMMVLITLVVVGAFAVSSTNMKSVNNMQVRDEALAAAHNAAEQYISGTFVNTTTLTTSTYNIDINKDGSSDYSVTVAPPTCVRAVAVTGNTLNDPPILTTSGWTTDWDVDSRVTDLTTGAVVRVRQGFRVLLTVAQKSAICP